MTGGRSFKSMAARFFSPALVVFLVAMVSGCGYHVAGHGGRMPGEVSSLTIPVFVNNTKKPDIESIMTTTFIDEFVTTVKVRDGAEARMKGVIRSYDLTPVSYTKSDVTQEYRLSVKVSLSLVGRDGEVLWEDRGLVDYEDFIVDTTDVTATEEAEIKAFRKLSSDLARLVKERMLENF